MDGFTSILVDIDATAVAHPATDRAIELARTCGSKLKIVDIVTVPANARRYLSADTEATVVQEHREQLEAVASTVTGVTVEFDVLQGRPPLALVDEVLRSGHDLLIRSHARDLVAGRPFSAVDMQLFRQCPSLVWAVAPRARTAPRRVLAAVHVAERDSQEQSMNRKIIETALLMARHGGGSVVVFQAWSAFGEDLLRGRSTPAEVAAYARAAKAAAREGLDDLVSSFGDRLRSAEVRLRKGYPEDIIPRFAVSEGIDLVVMGTVARKGIAGLIIGNTAERILQRLVCSVLAVKPDDFQTPTPSDA